MQDVAADRDRQSGDPALVPPDGQRVEQRLGRVLVRAVAGIDDRAGDLLGEQSDRARPSDGARSSTSGRMALSVIAVSISVSPFFTDEVATDMFMTSAPSRLPASSNEACVRVEASKNRLICVRPFSADFFLSVRRLTATSASARSSRGRRSPAAAGRAMPSRCRWPKTTDGVGSRRSSRTTAYRQFMRLSGKDRRQRMAMPSRIGGARVARDATSSHPRRTNQSSDYAGFNAYPLGSAAAALYAGLAESTLSTISKAMAASAVRSRPTISPVSPIPRRRGSGNSTRRAVGWTWSTTIRPITR